MALDPKELQQLAGLLGDVLAPRIREAVSENVAVRVAALAQTLRDEQREALDALQLTTARLVGESTETLSQKVFENGVQGKELLSASAGVTKNFIEAQVATLDEKVAAKFNANEERFAKLTESFTTDLGVLNAWIGEVRKLIPTVPTIPEPTKLLEEGELSAPMRAAMDVAMRQVMKPIFDAMLAPITEGLSNVETGLTKHSEAVASIARAASKDVDVLNVRIANELESIKAATSEQFRSVVDSVGETRIKLAEAKSEMSTYTENAVRVISEDVNAFTRVTEELSSLAKNAATKEDLKTLDSTVAEAIVKIRAEVLAETKGEIEAFESTTEARVQGFSEDCKQLQDAIAEASHTAASVQIQLEAGLQSVREESSAMAEGISGLFKLTAQTTAEKEESVKKEIDALRTESVTHNELTEKIAQTLAAIEQVRTVTAKELESAIASERTEYEKGGKEIVEEVAARLVAFKTNLEVLESKHAELQSEQNDARTANSDAAARITAMVQTASASADAANAEVLGLVEVQTGRFAEIVVGLEATKHAIDNRFEMLETADKDLSLEIKAAARDAVTAVADLTRRAVEIEAKTTEIETQAAKADKRIEAAHTDVKELNSELARKLDEARIAIDTAVADLTRRAVEIEAKAAEVETHSSEFAAKADKRIEAAHTRVKELNSEIARKLDETRIAIEANADAIATQVTASQISDALATRTSEVLAARALEIEGQIETVSNKLAKDISSVQENFSSEIASTRAHVDASIRTLSDSDALATRTGEVLAARALEIEDRIETVSNKLAKDINGVQEKFSSEIESTRVHVDTSIRTLSDSVERYQIREAISHEKTLESIAGARIEAQGSVEALRAEHAAAQERVEAEYARLVGNIEEVSKQALDKTTLVSKDLAEFRGAISDELVEVRATDAELAKTISNFELETKERFNEFITTFDNDTNATRELVESARAQTLVQLEAGLQGSRDEAGVRYAELTETLAELRTSDAASYAGMLSSAVSSAVDEMRQAYAKAEEQLASIRGEIDGAITGLHTYADAGIATVRDEARQNATAIGADVTERLGTAFVQIEAVQKSALDATDALTASLPGQVNAAVEAFDQPLRAAARDEIDRNFESALPNLLKQAREAAIATVPDLVVAQTKDLPEALRAALVPLAVAEATRVATEAGEAALGAAKGLAEGALAAARAAGESAIEQARGEAAGAAQMAATAATQGLRDDLLAALDPTERISKAVIAMVPLEVQDAVRKHVGEVEPRLYIDLAAKIQKEIDRIPRPRDGRDGDAGKHGKDARVAPPVPYEQGKRYDFGAWVAHANGVWVAARSTDAEPIADSADWDCVTPGIKAIETLLQDDGRTVELHFELTNGALHKSTLKMPVQIPRGVFDAEREYDVHDLCTFDGSQWVALKTGKLARPGLDASWKLQVKHGKDGKDLKQPAPQVIRHVGEWQPDTEYPTNVTVDHAGVRWLAMRSTRERPPFTTLTSNDTWTKLGS